MRNKECDDYVLYDPAVLRTSILYLKNAKYGRGDFLSQCIPFFHHAPNAHYLLITCF